MTIIKGVLEMLELSNNKGPKSFNDFTRISINQKKLSSATVSKRLSELVNAGVMEEVIIKSKTGRRIIAYKTTDKGRLAIKLAKQLKETLTNAK